MKYLFIFSVSPSPVGNTQKYISTIFNEICICLYFWFPPLLVAILKEGTAAVAELNTTVIAHLSQIFAFSSLLLHIRNVDCPSNKLVFIRNAINTTQIESESVRTPTRLLHT